MKIEIIEMSRPTTIPIRKIEMSKKLSPDEYERRANRLARDYVSIYECQKCWHPYVQGYCCTNCGTGTPETTIEKDQELEKSIRNLRK